MKQYYDTRAPEYDEWYLGIGLFAERDRPGWEEDLRELEHVVERMTPATTLDVACGTGFLTRHLRGEITGLDQSERMLDDRRRAAPRRRRSSPATHSRCRSTTASSSGCSRATSTVTSRPPERASVPRRGAPRRGGARRRRQRAARPDHEPEEWQARVLNDGSRYEVYKRFFDAAALADELGGGTVLHAGRWFVAGQLAPARAGLTRRAGAAASV